MSEEQKDQAQLSQRAQEILDLALSLNRARNMDEILLELIQRIITVCQAERATIYSIDPDTKELFSKVMYKGIVQEIRVPISRASIAGYAASTGKILNIVDAYDKKELAKYSGLRFDDTWDKKTGYRTKSILAVPLNYKDTGLQGVIQLINRKGGAFTKVDEKLVGTVAGAVAVAFYNQTRIKKKPSKFDLLLTKNIISENDVNNAVKKARDNLKGPIEGDVVSTLVNDFGVPKQMMGAALAQYYNTEFVEYSENNIIPAELLKGLSTKYLSSHFFVPLAKDGKTVVVLADDPTPQKLQEIKQIVVSDKIKMVVGLREDVLKYLEQAERIVSDTFDGDKTGMGETTSGMEVPGQDETRAFKADEEEDLLTEEAPSIVQAINQIIQTGFDRGVSDIHIEPYGGQNKSRVRFRQDGACYHYREIPNAHVKALINRIKIMSSLKLDEHRIPQSGKIKMNYGGQDVELRVEVTPTAGDKEDVVMRILASGEPMPLEKMNFASNTLEQVKEIIAKPYGIILVVGPTGSGKTTTLHSILGRLNQPEKKIWTAEDPVEITQYGLRQVQVAPNIKPTPFTFATAMRSFLRADPDVIMVGEMRDKETATIAIEASLTGHLVLSTLHTNSAPETITRLVEMGMNPINLSDAVLGVLAQRLVRTLCNKCKMPYEPTDEELELMAAEYGTEYVDELQLHARRFQVYRPRGCPECNNTGYRGRTGIHELLPGTKEIKRLIRRQASIEDIRDSALKQGMRTLKMDGIQKVLKGQTDLIQVLTVCID